MGTGFPSRQTPRAFARRSCSNKKIERDDDSKKSHHALKEPDSAASLIRGHKAWRRHPLYGHLNTVFGGKRGGAEREKTQARKLGRTIKLGFINRFLQSPGRHLAATGAGSCFNSPTETEEPTRQVLRRRPWHWPGPSCRASPHSSSCPRHMPMCSALAPRSLLDRCWCRQAP